MAGWQLLKCSVEELNLDVVLSCGQSFRWRKNQLGEWIGVIGSRVWFLKQDEEGNILYKVHANSREKMALNLESKKGSRKRKLSEEMVEKNSLLEVLRDYFQLDVNLTRLYDQWKGTDNAFCAAAKRFPGVRIMRQDPLETLMSFICSSNNNISRISSMVEKLCKGYGEKLADINGETYYAFPSVDKLSHDHVENELRLAGFGYRAKYIRDTAKQLCSYNPGWLESLRHVPYNEAHASLVKLPGVGAKVADCVCLMSLDKSEAIPVDTHVWQIARRDYLPHLAKTKTLTEKSYKEVGDFFRNLFGPYAGWAHSVLFTSDLRQFKT